MTLRGSLLVFAVGALLAWGAWFLVLKTVPPGPGGALAEAFFFGSLFLAIAGTLTILGVLGRMRTSAVLPSLHLSASFRQGILLALAVSGTLLLSRLHFLRWWNVVLFGGALLLFDLALTRRHRSR